jgi:hypothetical protein
LSFVDFDFGWRVVAAAAAAVAVEVVVEEEALRFDAAVKKMPLGTVAPQVSLKLAEVPQPPPVSATQSQN